jgi:hypothetical protein
MLSELEERLANVERSDRRLKTAFSACLCCALVIALTGAAQTSPKVIEAQKVILRDTAGNERAELFANESAWGLVLFNKDNTRGASLFVTRNKNALILNDPNGNLRQVLTSDLNQSELQIFRPGSDSAQFEVIDTSEGTGLTFRDRTNAVRAELGLSQKGPVLIMSDADQTPRAIVEGAGLGFATISKNGDLEWSPGWEKFSPEQKAKLRELMPKFPK